MRLGLRTFLSGRQRFNSLLWLAIQARQPIGRDVGLVLIDMLIHEDPLVELLTGAWNPLKHELVEQLVKYYPQLLDHESRSRVMLMDSIISSCT